MRAESKSELELDEKNLKTNLGDWYFAEGWTSVALNGRIDGHVIKAGIWSSSQPIYRGEQIILVRYRCIYVYWNGKDESPI